MHQRDSLTCTRKKQIRRKDPWVRSYSSNSIDFQPISPECNLYLPYLLRTITHLNHRSNRFTIHHSSLTMRHRILLQMNWVRWCTATRASTESYSDTKDIEISPARSINAYKTCMKQEEPRATIISQSKKNRMAKREKNRKRFKPITVRSKITKRNENIAFINSWTKSISSFGIIYMFLQHSKRQRLQANSSTCTLDRNDWITSFPFSLHSFPLLFCLPSIIHLRLSFSVSIHSINQLKENTLISH